MKHVIIGGCGFIGFNLAVELLEKGNEVLVLDNVSRKGSAHNLLRLMNHPFSQNLTFQHCDIRLDKHILARVVNDADVIYHLAAQVAVTTSVVNPLLDFEINLLGTFNIIEAMRSQGSKAILIYASTNKVYGGMEEITIVEGEEHYYYKDMKNGIPESQNLDFHSPYGCSKGAAEQYIRDYSRIYGLRTICFRQSCIYGPNQFGIEDQGWVAWFTIASMYNKPITIFGNGKQVRDVLHVKDLIDGYQMAISNIGVTNGQIYNMGGGAEHQLSLLKLIAMLEQKLDKKILFTFGDWRPGDQPVYVSDIAKVTRDTGWKPKIAFHEGINALLSWSRENEEILTQVGII